MNFLEALRGRLRTGLSTLLDDPGPYVEMLRPAQDPKFGDFQINCAMTLKGKLGQPPRVIAERIVAACQWDDLCEPAEIAGPGFINLRLRSERLATETSQLLGDSRAGSAPVAAPRHVIVDYSGPNVAKPMHVGHLRSTVIGHALVRVLKFLGHRVTSDNHLGDWGTQFGMIIYGYKHFLNAARFAESPVTELARLYRLVNQLSDYHELQAELPALEAAVTQAEQRLAAADSGVSAMTAQSVSPAQKSALADAQKQQKRARQDSSAAGEALAAARKKLDAVNQQPELAALAVAHPRIRELSRLETSKLHAGDAENLALWQQFMPHCLAALQSVYDRFGIQFDLTLGESHYNPMLADVVSGLKSAGLANDSQGAVCVFLEGHDAPMIVQKADKAYTYATTDLATIQDRVERLKADSILYVVDARQSEHFQQLFAVARKLGYAAVELKHVSFGTVMGQDGKPYKTRSGDTVGLESLLDEAIAKARQVVEDNAARDRGEELSEAERASAAVAVGLGGLIYADLHHNRESDYIYDQDKMLATRGDTATYIQYAYARTRGILRKAGVTRDELLARRPAIHLSQPAERALALQLNRLPETLAEVCVEYRPNVLTQFLYQTADAFTTFFDQCPVVKEPDAAIRDSRLALCELTGQVLATGLDLLGIRVVASM